MSPTSILTGFILTNYGIRGMRNFGKENKDKESYLDLETILKSLNDERDLLNISSNIEKIKGKPVFHAGPIIRR